MAEDEDDDNSNRRVGKKKYYPFGTPSHLHHAYSEFAHIAVDNRDFAIQLATATGIKAEVVVEEKPKKARRVPIAKKKAAPAVGEEESVGSATVDEPEEAACTKIACVMIMRALNDMEYRNEVERLDLEDEYEHHVAELRVAEQDLAVAEGRLDKVNDIGNQLEMSADQMILKVETLEKTKEALKVEHNEINSKVPPYPPAPHDLDNLSMPVDAFGGRETEVQPQAGESPQGPGGCTLAQEEGIAADRPGGAGLQHL